MNCKNCGAALREKARFCPMCGSAVADVPGLAGGKWAGGACPGCGAQTKPEAKFCGKCGVNLTEAAMAAAAGTPVMTAERPGIIPAAPIRSAETAVRNRDTEAAVRTQAAEAAAGTDGRTQAGAAGSQARDAAVKAAKQIAKQFFEKNVNASQTAGEMRISLGEAGNKDVTSVIKAVLR